MKHFLLFKNILILALAFAILRNTEMVSNKESHNLECSQHHLFVRFGYGIVFCFDGLLVISFMVRFVMVFSIISFLGLFLRLIQVEAELISSYSSAYF